MTSSPLGGRSTCDQVLADRDLADRNMLVTGCSAGIGFETARSLSAHGAHVLLACRSLDSAKQTAARIRAQHPTARLTEVVLDLSSFASIRAAVSALPASPLHAVICNAGLYTPTFQTTAEGIESTVGVCHFGHFLLVTLLLDRLRAAAPARVVMVSSESHRHPSKLNFDRFPLPQNHYRPLVAYGQAKLCNVLFANELTRRFERDGITANSLHPGAFIGTSIFRRSLSAKLLAAALSPFTKTIEQGAATSVYCAVAPELEGVGGGYYADCSEKVASAFGRDQAAAERLWALSTARLNP